MLSSGSIDRLTEAQVSVTIKSSAGETVGANSIYLSDLWAWPDPKFTHEQRDATLRHTCEQIAEQLPALVGDEAAHPLELGLRLHESVCNRSDTMPVLALAMCLSPFDAAIHDAMGKAMGVSAMRLYDVAAPTSADGWFKGGSAVAAIRATLRARPQDRLPAWLIVGKNDDLEHDVRPWFDKQGYRCFKLKPSGRDVSEDVTRTTEVARAAMAWGCTPRLSVDANEACPDAEFVLEYLRALQRHDAWVFDRLEYLEQPTARDIMAHSYDWRPVEQLKPVLLDEGLTSLDLLPLALEQGWSGFALKTCKGHSFALVTAAWAREHGLSVALQDLTNPGAAAVHAALFAAHMPTINGVELNSPQFTPAANELYQPDWPGLFNVCDGEHRIAHPGISGLGARA